MRFKLILLFMNLTVCIFGKCGYTCSTEIFGDYLSPENALYRSVKISIENCDSVPLLVCYRTSKFGSSFSNCPVEQYLDEVGYNLILNNDTLQHIPSYMFTDIIPGEKFTFNIAYPNSMSLISIQKSIKVYRLHSIGQMKDIFEKLKYKSKEITFVL